MTLMARFVGVILLSSAVIPETEGRYDSSSVVTNVNEWYGTTDVP